MRLESPKHRTSGIFAAEHAFALAGPARALHEHLARKIVALVLCAVLVFLIAAFGYGYSRVQRILDAATVEFSLHGFENANMTVIAKKAQVSVGSLYKYFDTKQDLYLTTARVGIDKLKAILYEVAGADEDVLLKLRDVIRAIQKTSREYNVLIKLYNGMTGENSSEMLSALSRDMESVSAQLYAELIRKGQQSGEIRSDLSPEMGAFMLDNLFMSLQFTYACDYYSERFKVFAGEDIFDRDEFVTEEMIKFIKSAFASKEQKK